MADFPVYEQLASQNLNLSLEEIQNRIQLLKHSDHKVVQERSTVIFYLVLHHYQLNGGNPKIFLESDLTKSRTRLQLPYGIKVNTIGKSLSLDLNACPEDLQQIIGAYLDNL